jgi:transcriptional regulator with XRE-family HTH domain
MNTELIKQRMKELKLTREALAVKVGVSFTTIYNMSRGARPNQDNLNKLADVLGVSVEDLIKSTAFEVRKLA